MTDFHMFSMESYSVDYMGRILPISYILKILRTTMNFSCEALNPTRIFLPFTSHDSHSPSIWTRAFEKGEFLRITVLVR